MRYFWPLVAYASVIIVAVSCGSGKGTGSTSTNGTGGQGGTHSNSTSTSGTSNGGFAPGGGGSTGTFNFPDAGDSGPCPAYKGDCTAQALNCGMATDGCGNVLDCGTCPPDETCGANNVPNVCSIACTPKSCADQGFNCGMATDGCGTVIDCGSCDGGTCGGTQPNVCGAGPCMPKSCTDQGFNCGMQTDGCNNVLSCGTCPANQICGANNMPGVCGTPLCMPKTCADQGFNCGMATDGCGNIINCGMCTGNNICGGAAPNVCGLNPCTGLCTQQTTCMGTATTSVSGKVYAPNGVDPLYNVLVYVPNGSMGAPTWGVQPFAPGVQCGACGAEVTGTPLISTVTGVDGSFTLNNMPVGANIPLVIQNGRWRRKISIPNVPACVTTTLTAAQTRMPRKQTEFDAADNIPLIAFSTGEVDSLECVLRKIGIDDTQFSDPAAQGGNGRVRFYQGEGAPGAYISGNTPSATQLWGTQAEIDQYDMVFFPCQGAQYSKNATQQSVVRTYANAGGRIFATHFSYVWLNNDAVFKTTANWAVNGTQPTPDPQTGYINQTFMRGQALAQWLQVVGASTTQGQMSVNTLRHDFNNVVSPSLLWVSLGAPTIPPGTVPMHYTFDTPVGSMPANQCGRVLFDDFHVEDAECDANFSCTNNPGTFCFSNTDCTGLPFPQECNNNPMTPQEKMLEFMIFDLGSCVAPPVCVPKTCAEVGATCGPASDGCGNIIQCGTCPSNEACVSGMCVGCTPKTCAQQNFHCGMQGDGCGNIIDCGGCLGNQSCSGGTCTIGVCSPKSCTDLNAQCGSVGDGCGNIIDCGMCPPGEICGGGGVPNQCYKPPCVPKTCAQQGFDCGSATDGCGTTINCGTCSSPQVCGGCGTPNVCCGAG